MLDLAFEVIGQAVSNSFLMLCFCNLIVVMIHKRSKSELGVSEETNFPRSAGSNMDWCSKEEVNFAPMRRENDQLLIDVAEIQYEHEETAEYDEENGHNCGDDDQEEDQNQREEEEEADELRKSVEAFIAKVNKEWKNEKLRALNLQTPDDCK